MSESAAAAKSSVRRGLADAAVAVVGAYIVAYAMILTSGASAAPYRWLVSHISWAGALVTLALSPILLPIGFVVALIHGQIVDAISCIIAVVVVRRLVVASNRRRREGNADAIPAVFLVSLIWWIFVAWSR